MTSLQTTAADCGRWTYRLLHASRKPLLPPPSVTNHDIQRAHLHRERPSGRTRLEIDLDPGTVIVPLIRCVGSTDTCAARSQQRKSANEKTKQQMPNVKEATFSSEEATFSFSGFFFLNIFSAATCTLVAAGPEQKEERMQPNGTCFQLIQPDTHNAEQLSTKRT